MIKHGFCLLSLGTLAACATTPTPVESAHPVPASETFATPFSNSALLLVTRDKGLVGIACSIHLLVDGYEAGKLGTGEKLSLYVQGGQHVITAMRDASCGEGSAEATVSIGAGSTLAYRVGASQGGEIQLGQTVLASGSMH